MKVGKVTLFPFEIDKTFPLKANDCASVSVKVGKLNEPPPLESVITIPDCDKVWVTRGGKFTGVLATPFTVVINWLLALMVLEIEFTIGADA